MLEENVDDGDNILFRALGKVRTVKKSILSRGEDLLIPQTADVPPKRSRKV